MPHVAVIGQVLRSNQTRNGTATFQNNNNNNNNNNHVGHQGRGSVVTPAWNIPENARKFENGLHQPVAPPLEQAHSRQLSAYRRWMSKNNNNRVAHSGQRRMVNASLNRVVKFSSVSSRKYRETPSGAVVLYMGIGMFLVGLVITFVGVGEKGFQTLELQLIGPCLTGLGLLLCGIRVIICCFCASRCSYCDELIQKEGSARRSKSPSASSGRSLPPNNRVHTTSAMLFNGKRGPNARPTTPMTSPPSTSKPHMPSTSTARARLEGTGKSHSWDSQSLDLHFNEPGSANGSLNRSSSFDSESADEAGDEEANKFREIEITKAALVHEEEPERPFSRESLNNFEPKVEPLQRVETELERGDALKSGSRNASANNKMNKLSNGIVLDPQQYLNRATMAALNSHNKL